MSKRKRCVRDPAYARTLGLLRCIPFLFLLCFHRGYRSQQTFRLDYVLVLVLCRGPGVVPRRVFCVDAPSAQSSMGIQQYSKPLSPLLHWALCCLSFNIPLAMRENFADSLAQ